MNLRRLLLHVMLWSLGLAAALGASAVLMVPSKVVWRIVGTGMTTALAALLMLMSAIASEKPKLRAAGLLGMALVVAEYLGALSLIWNLHSILFAGQPEEEIALTMLLGAPVGLVAMSMLRATGSPETRLAGRVGVVLCAVEAVLLLIAIWGVDFFKAFLNGDDEWYGTAAAFAIFAVMAVASLVGTGGGWRLLLRAAGVVATTVALAVTIVVIWKHLHGNGGGYAVLVSVASWLAYANVMLAMPLPRRQEWLRISTLIAAALTAGAVDFGFIQKRDAMGDWSQRVAASTGILAGCGTLAIAVLVKMNRCAQIEPNVMEQIRELTVICPICRKKQDAVLGDSTCVGCGLRFHLGVEPPRCASCGYMLLMNKSGRCPECGAAATAPAT